MGVLGGRNSGNACRSWSEKHQLINCQVLRQTSVRFVSEPWKPQVDGIVYAISRPLRGIVRPCDSAAVPRAWGPRRHDPRKEGHGPTVSEGR